MTSLRQALKKRYVLALVVGGVVFATAYAFAATLSVTTKTLGAGNTTVAACTSNTLQASYALTFQGGTGNTIGTGGTALDMQQRGLRKHRLGGLRRTVGSWAVLRLLDLGHAHRRHREPERAAEASC